MKNRTISARTQAGILVLLSVIWGVFLSSSFLVGCRVIDPPWAPFLEPFVPFLLPFALLLHMFLGMRFLVKEYANKTRHPFSYYFGILFAALPFLLLGTNLVGPCLWYHEWLNPFSLDPFSRGTIPRMRWVWINIWVTLTTCLIVIGCFSARLKILTVLGLLSLFLWCDSVISAFSAFTDTSIPGHRWDRIGVYWHLFWQAGFLSLLVTAIPAFFVAWKEKRHGG